MLKDFFSIPDFFFLLYTESFGLMTGTGLKFSELTVLNFWNKIAIEKYAARTENRSFRLISIAFFSYKS